MKFEYNKGVNKDNYHIAILAGSVIDSHCQFILFEQYLGKLKNQAPKANVDALQELVRLVKDQDLNVEYACSNNIIHICFSGTEEYSPIVSLMRAVNAQLKKLGILKKVL